MRGRFVGCAKYTNESRKFINKYNCMSVTTYRWGRKKIEIKGEGATGALSRGGKGGRLRWVPIFALRAFNTNSTEGSIVGDI